MITREQIRNLLNGVCDQPIARADADQMAADYPYFAIPQLLYLKYTPGAMPDERRIQQALLHASPGEHLESVLGIEGESFADLYSKAPRTDTTMQAIDLFLGTYQKGGKLPTEESLDRLISGNIIAQTDYMRLLQQDDPQPAVQSAQPIQPTVEVPKPSPEHKSEPAPAPAPARKSPAERENTLQTVPSEPAADDTFFTESLAKIYIKQRRYEKALQIIKKLSLKYPEKNIYFADQIRFLEKLIINIKTE